MGNFVNTPAVTDRSYYYNPTQNVATPNLSAGRFPDGYDTDNNKYDFRLQPNFNLAADMPAGKDLILLTSVQGLVPGQRIYIGDKDNQESVQVATVGIKTEGEGIGVGIATPLKNAHKAGEAITVNLPTPGRPNRY
jgi:hypothetical protein